MEDGGPAGMEHEAAKALQHLGEGDAEASARADAMEDFDIAQAPEELRVAIANATKGALLLAELCIPVPIDEMSLCSGLRGLEAALETPPTHKMAEVIAGIGESVTEIHNLRKEAVSRFNAKPRRALDLLQGSGLIQPSCAEDVAAFLWTSKGVSKRRLGEFFGKRRDFNQEVLAEYLTRLDFEDQPLDEALRTLLVNFRLPGEAQMIDRILERFSLVYHGQNPDTFVNAEVCYIVSFSLIMLNTDLHSQSIPDHKKMTVQQFVSQHRDVNNGQPLPRSLCEDFYARIKAREIRMEDTDHFESEYEPFMGAAKAGWLSKQGEGLITSWHRFWFVLKSECLYYFYHPSDTERPPRCTISLENVRIGRGTNRRDVVLLPLRGSVVRSTKLVDNHEENGHHTQFVLRCRDEAEREEWVRALQESAVVTASVVESPPEEILRPSSSSTGAVVLPTPVTEGWMRKRGVSNSAWKNRYVVLVEFPNDDAVLFYFVNQFSAQRMLDLGDVTHQGAIMLRNVRRVVERTDDGVRVIELHTQDRNWILSPEPQEFELWFTLLEERARNAVADRPISAMMQRISEIASQRQELERQLEQEEDEDDGARS